MARGTGMQPKNSLSLPELGDPHRTIGQRTFDFSKEVAVMAILNRTQDSFYDHGATFTFEAALAKVESDLESGADWIDIGAVPFSPIAASVGEEEEINRIVPLIEYIRGRTDAVLSVDTFRSEVAKRALAAGADVINDTSGLGDPRMAGVIAEARACVVITHSKARPMEQLRNPTYEDVVSEVREFLIARSAYAQEQGIDPAKIIVDPGHDLNKNTYHSLELTRRLSELNDLGYPLLVAVSNKDFIAEALDAPQDELGPGTIAAIVICVLQGARIVRVHDPRTVISAINVVAAMLGWRLPPSPKHNLG
jgi:dihydropteroate synthase